MNENAKYVIVWENTNTLTVITAQRSEDIHKVACATYFDLEAHANDKCRRLADRHGIKYKLNSDLYGKLLDY